MKSWWTDAVAREFGFQVRQARLARGWSLKKMAEAVYGDEWRYPLVSRVESANAHGVETTTVLKYCRALDLDVRKALWLVDALPCP